MRKTLAYVAVVLVLAGGLIALLGPRHCPVNRAAFERVEEGMTRAEVHSILGGPPGDYRTGPAGPHYPDRVWGDPPVGHVEMWFGDEGVAAVAYRETPAGVGDVVLMHFEEAPAYSPSLVELARWRLGWLGAWLP